MSDPGTPLVPGNPFVTKVIPEALFTEPKNIEEAKRNIDYEYWEGAIDAETKNLSDHGTWILVKYVSGMRIIKTKWVFKVKYFASGDYEKHKARLVARGFSQIKGVNFDETHAPVVRLGSLRCLIAYASNQNWTLWHIDIKGAFLNAELKEHKLYMEVPENMRKGNEGMVCELVKSIYGLKQSGRLWWFTICEFLIGLGFKQSVSEPCLFVSSKLCLCVYTDDILIAGTCVDAYQSLKKSLVSKFDINDLGEATSFVGIRIAKNDTGYRLDQTAYIDEILALYRMTDCTPADTPMQNYPSPNLTKSPACDKPFRNAIGKLRYLVDGTFPNLAPAVQILSSRQHNYREEDWTAVKRIFRWLKKVRTQYIQYGGSDERIGSSDASLSMCTETRRSTSGYIFKWYGGPVTWQCKRQTIVATSSMEAELVSLCTTAKEGVYLNKCAIDLGIPKDSLSIIIEEDNQSCIKWCENPVFHSRSKHIEVRYYFIRDMVQKREVKVI
jgi:hypothetical protein